MPRRKPRRSELGARRRRHTAASSNGNKPGRGTPPSGTSQPGEPKRARVGIRRILLVALLAVPVTGVVILLGITSVFREVPGVGAIISAPAHPPLDNLHPQLRAYLETFVAQGEADPDDPDKQYTLGLVFAANRMWERSRGYFLRAASLDPTNYLFTFYLGISRAKTGDLNGAIELFHRTVELRKGFAPAYHRLGDALLQTGAMEEAESAFRDTLAVAPFSGAAYLGLADVMLSVGEYTEAAAFANKALELSADDPTGHYLIGLAYRAQGRWDLAQRHLAQGANSQKPYMSDPGTRALAVHSKVLGDQIKVAMAKTRANETDQGVAMLEALLEWYPREVTLRSRLATVYRLAKAYDKSLHLLEETIEFYPTMPAVYIELARHYLALGRLPEALRAAEKATEVDPTAYSAHEVRGGILYRMERREEALAAWEQSMAIRPATPMTLLYAGMAAKSLGKWDVAQAHLESAIRHKPSLVLAYVTLAELHLLQGDLDAAGRVEQNARELFPENFSVSSLTRKLERSLAEAGR